MKFFIKKLQDPALTYPWVVYFKGLDSDKPYMVALGAAYKGIKHA